MEDKKIIKLQISQDGKVTRLDQDGEGAVKRPEDKRDDILSPGIDLLETEEERKRPMQGDSDRNRVESVDDDDDDNDDDGDGSEDPFDGILPEMAEEKRWPAWKKMLLITSIMALLFGAAYLILQLRHFDMFTVEHTEEVKRASASKYLMLQENLVKYNNDGAIYEDSSGRTIWNETYEMTDPIAKKSGNMIIIYDREGSSIHIMSTTGAKGVINTSLPITNADVSSEGNVAILMQNGGTGHLEIMNPKGDVLASGEVHFENSGYPLGIAISPNSEKLMVSLLSVKEGKPSTIINFYNFGNAGQKAIDNIVSTYTYEGMVAPEIDFFENGRALAFGNDRIQLFDAGAKPRESTRIKPKGDMISVFHNDSIVGYLTQEEDEDSKELQDTIEVYSTRGFHRYSKKIDSSYNEVVLMDNNEVMVSDGKDIAFYNTYGVKRFEYSFENTVHAILPQNIGREYLVVYQDSIDRIKLR